MKQIKQLSPATVTQNAQLKALESVLLKTHEFFERKVRRWFSKQYSTPYMQTFDIPWEELLLHYYEANIENLSYNEVFDLAVQEYLPEFVDKKEEEDEEYAKSLEKEQEASIQAYNLKKAKEAAKLMKIPPQGSNDEIKDRETQSVKGNRKDNKVKDQPKPKAMSLKFDDEGDPDDK